MLQLDFKQRTRAENPTIVFSVGFEYADRGDGIARCQRIDDANSQRGSSRSDQPGHRHHEISERAKFRSFRLTMRRLDAKIAQLKLSQGKSDCSGELRPAATTLAQLKAELVQKSAFIRSSIRSSSRLKRQIEAMEKAASSPANPCSTDPASSGESGSTRCSARSAAEKSGRGFGQARGGAAWRKSREGPAVRKAGNHRTADRSARADQAQSSESRRTCGSAGACGGSRA